MNKPTPKARNTNLVIQKVKDETLLYDLSNNKAFCLNDTSMTVWQLSDGQRSFEQIAAKMSKTLKTIVSEELVFLAIDQLNKEHLLEDRDKLNDFFAGLSRRDVIKKVGFSTLVAIPIVSSLIAPKAAHAQSCLPTSNTNPGGISSCFTDGECCSGHCLNSSSCCNPGAVFPTHHSLGCQVQASCPRADSRCCGGTVLTHNNSPFCNGLTDCVCN